MTGLWQSQSQQLDKSFICDSPIASKSPGILKESSRQIGCSGNLEEEEIPIPTQRRVLKDGKWMLHWKDVQGNLSRQKKAEKCRTRIPRISRKPRNSRKFKRLGNRRQNLATSFLNVSPDCVPHTNKIFSIVRQTYGRSPTDDLKDLDVNTAIWCIFMSVTLQAAVHLGQVFTDNVRSTKNQHLNFFETVISNE